MSDISLLFFPSVLSCRVIFKLTLLIQKNPFLQQVLGFRFRCHCFEAPCTTRFHGVQVQEEDFGRVSCHSPCVPRLLLHVNMSLPPGLGVSQTSGLAAESSLLAKALDGFWWASRPYLAARQEPGTSHDGLHFVQGREAVHGRAAGCAALLNYDRGARALTMAFKGRRRSLIGSAT